MGVGLVVVPDKIFGIGQVIDIEPFVMSGVPAEPFHKVLLNGFSATLGGLAAYQAFDFPGRGHVILVGNWARFSRVIPGKGVVVLGCWAFIPFHDDEVRTPDQRANTGPNHDSSTRPFIVCLYLAVSHF